MPVDERDSAKEAGTEESAAPAGWIARLNEIGERHARLIISVSTALVILTVLVFARHFYDRSMTERAEQDAAQGGDAARLKELKEKYASYPAAATLCYRLANRYVEENQFDKADQEYREFQTRFPSHPLTPLVLRAQEALKRNMEFEKGSKESLLRQEGLRPHPTGLPGTSDPRLQWGPLPEPNPTATLELPGGKVTVELYEYEAPNAVANFIKLCEEKYFDGVKLDLVNGEERLKTQPRAEKPAYYLLALEKSDRKPVEGSLLLVAKEGTTECPGGEFQIVLKAPGEIKDAVVFGFVKDGLPVLKTAKKDDAIKAAAVVSKRDHKYEPAVIRKP
jgi:cyclophilin family peptidyl-prolyl cis-trans isomerase